MHYYKFNIGDYHTHTSHLDPLEDIAYRRMIDWIYLHESPLPLDVKQIAKYIRMRDECERITDVLQEFFKETEYGYTQNRVIKEIEHFKDKSAKAKKAVEARWAKKPNKSDTDVLQSQSEGNTNHKPLTNNHKTDNTTQDKLASSFEKFWELFNKKVDKKKCFVTWKNLSAQDRIDAFGKVAEYVKSTPNQHYRKNPRTWLNGRCWEDEIISQEQKAQDFIDQKTPSSISHNSFEDNQKAEHERQLAIAKSNGFDTVEEYDHWQFQEQMKRLGSF